MTARPTPSAKSRSPGRWTATRTIQALAVLCVALALMCFGLALMWQRQHDAAECWRAAAEYHLAPESCGGQPIPAD
ncbi:MAG: hypothetical protein JWQ29_1256 [Phenylobacterium sp.]|nr:hypothetical protein [Phenylobacterium sp.]